MLFINWFYDKYKTSFSNSCFCISEHFIWYNIWPTFGNRMHLSFRKLGYWKLIFIRPQSMHILWVKKLSIRAILRVRIKINLFGVKTHVIDFYFLIVIWNSPINRLKKVYPNIVSIFQLFLYYIEILISWHSTCPTIMRRSGEQWPKLCIQCS